MSNSTGINQYRQTNAQTALSEVSPHQLITMLMDGALDKIASAKGFISRLKNDEGVRTENLYSKGTLINHAIGIVGALQSSLDMEKGGEVADNLDRLYDYIIRRLTFANAKNDPVILDEAITLIKEIKDGWQQISPDEKSQTS